MVKEKNKKSKESNFLFNLFKMDKKYTVEDTIQLKTMTKDGICQISDKKFSKTIDFTDINYQLAEDSEKEIIFNSFANFLNYFDQTMSLSFTYVNQKGRNKHIRDAIKIPDKQDGNDHLREEYREMLKEQFRKGNNNISKKKFLTVTIEADSLQQARVRLEKIEIDILTNFKNMGVVANSLSGMNRLNILHDILNPDKEFQYSGDIKSCISPEQFDFSKGKFKFGNYYGRISHLEILANELSDKFLSQLLEIEDENINISFHIEPIEQSEAVKKIKSVNTSLDAMKIDEQKRAVRAGYDMDIIPSDLNTFGNDVKALLSDVQSRDEKLFKVTIVLMNYEKSRKKLEVILDQIGSIVNQNNCKLKTLDFMQEQGLITILPLGLNEIPINRYLTTSSTAVFMPFMTEELFVNSTESLYYGLNGLSHNLIMADRKKLKNPNGLILGTPGSGKSFFGKREIVNSFLLTDDDIIICDPEGEYFPLVQELGGTVIDISAKSKSYINPLDINFHYGDDDDPLKEKSNFVLSMLELMVSPRQLTARERSIIDRCLPVIYRKYIENPVKENMPTLKDLYNVLCEQKEKEGKKLATDIELYVHGSLNVFNHRTNIELDNRLISFNIKELGNQLKKIGMLVIQDQVWNKVSRNRGIGKSTRYYIDELHLLLKDEQTAGYTVEMWKRFRKWGGIPTGLTQNVKDMLRSQEIENIFDNTDFVALLNQAPGDAEILAKKLKISPLQLRYITNSIEGAGLICFGKTIVPFVDKFPKDTILYQKMTTKPKEIKRKIG